MGVYSIKDLEKISGIKAHTIRIWEQRYKILTPQRTDTNIRLYDDQQLKKLLNIKSLIDNGLKISKISNLSEVEMTDNLERITTNSIPKEAHYQIYVNDLIFSGLNFQEAQFEKTISNSIVKYGFYNVQKNIIYPLLKTVGLMWGKDELNPAQEHFISNIIKQKLFSAIDGISVDPNSTKNFVLFLPENEDHEIGLLFANYLLRNAGYRTLYLGQRVPYPNLEETIAAYKPTHLFTILTVHQSSNDVKNYLKKLSALPEEIKVYISGNSILFSSLILDRVQWIDSLDDFENQLL